MCPDTYPETYALCSFEDSYRYQAVWNKNDDTARTGQANADAKSISALSLTI